MVVHTAEALRQCKLARSDKPLSTGMGCLPGQLLVAALRKLDNSPMPNADVRGLPRTRFSQSKTKQMPQFFISVARLLRGGPVDSFFRRACFQRK